VARRGGYEEVPAVGDGHEPLLTAPLIGMGGPDPFAVRSFDLVGGVEGRQAEKLSRVTPVHNPEMLPPSTPAGACVGVGPPKPGMGVTLWSSGQNGPRRPWIWGSLELAWLVGAAEAHGDVDWIEPHPGNGVCPLEHVVDAAGEQI
jgi:hypothetical protein